MKSTKLHLFPEKKESNDVEEDESISLESFEEEEGEWGIDLIAIKNDLDPDLILKIGLMLMVFSPEVILFEGLIFFDAGSFSVLCTTCEGNSKCECVFEKIFLHLEV